MCSYIQAKPDDERPAAADESAVPVLVKFYGGLTCEARSTEDASDWARRAALQAAILEDPCLAANVSN